MSESPDVIVVGAGLAGLVSTLELLRSGHSVLLLDRCEPKEIGGLAREAFGGMFMVDSPEQRRSRIPDNEGLALEDWLRIAEFDPEDTWPRRWAEQYVTRARDDVGGWLRQLGVKFFPVVNWAERGNFGDGNSVPRFHLTWGTGKALVQAVWGGIEAHPRRSALDLRLRSRVTGLISEGDRIVGCRVSAEHADSSPSAVPAKGGVKRPPQIEDTTPAPEGTHWGENPAEELNKPDQYEVRAAKAVVIAAGGIGGNLELVRREWPTSRLGPAPEKLLMGSHYYADGAMHEEVGRIGGNVTHLSRMWNYADAVRHPKPQRPAHGLKLIPPRSGVMLDPDGRRYGPVPVMPTFDAYSALERMCEDERKYSWLVCNFKIAKRELDVSGSQHNPYLRERRLAPFLLSVLLGKAGLVEHFLEGSPDFVSAGSLEELAAKMNDVTAELHGERAIDPQVLQREIGRYDATISRGKGLFNDDQLRRIGQLRNWRGDRLRTARFQRIVDPKAMPLVAIRLQPMARKSLGGIQTDLGCRVLRAPGDAAHDAQASAGTGRGGEPIPGLYAIGEAAGFGGGGVHGKRSLEGTFLGGCVFTGRLAAATIAGAELPVRIPPRLG
ncbi:MAG TPA: FAD-binding protein [Solirubrobacteraceae bacterium]|jgi:predicted oxidoreductase|nr:FAD-binding protein [Solirubrobacteraceae bacterium]